MKCIVVVSKPWRFSGRAFTSCSTCLNSVVSDGHSLVADCTLPLKTAGNLKSVPQENACGVFHESEKEDISTLVNNFTAPALARALRERENTLQRVAKLVIDNCETDENSDTKPSTADFRQRKLDELLRPYLKASVESRVAGQKFDLAQLPSSTSGSNFTKKELNLMQRYLHKMPRWVDPAAGSHLEQRRASVVIPLCNVNGVASILFERRSGKVRTHKQQVCFPGGMVDEDVDATIIQTSLREMEEELGVAAKDVSVLGILRCNWNEVANMTGIAVTPVVGFIGELSDLTLAPNPDEVEDIMTVPLVDLLDDTKWAIRNFSAPMFTGAPHMIWGLTGYLLERFLKDVVIKCNRQKEII